MVMITKNSAHTYYIHRDQPMGFEYELALEFARELGVELRVVTADWSEIFEKLSRGRGDFIAAGITANAGREDLAEFSLPYDTVRQRLILHENHPFVRRVSELEGLTIHIGAGTTYQERLTELQGEGIGLEMVIVPDVLTEELIRQVAEGKIEATVADSNIAFLNRRYYPDVRVGIALSEEQPLVWAVRKGDSDLLESMNLFLEKVKNNGTLASIRRFYHDDRNRLHQLDIEAFHRSLEEDFPLYEEQIKAAAQSYGFDWRLITAMIYQESRFRPHARSYTGVRGLMQVTLDTAREMGIENRLDPEQSIRAGVKYLALLLERFSGVEDPRQQLYLALAAYNIGYGHVRDAQKIARSRGQDPTSWSSLRETLPLLGHPEYYRNTRYGYARGTEPVAYVTNIMTYFDILIGKIKSSGDSARLKSFSSPLTCYSGAALSGQPSWIPGVSCPWEMMWLVT